MNDDFPVPLSRVVALTLSTVAVLMIFAAWIAGAASSWPIGIMVGVSAIPVIAAASVSWVRCYSLQICALLKAREVIRESRQVSSIG